MSGKVLAYCGHAGESCADCDDKDLCTSDSCTYKSTCAHSNVANETNCSGGMCFNGSCCTGCWDGSTCMKGITKFACGIEGKSCQTCEKLEICASGSCSPI
ncbi:MAG: hypothetical protein KAI47_26315 [Deltaproteobacteria bacterium]|nr:hypothetical protein [Deltaproteobacteria bacterium]